jgi:hypothetical protein
VDTEPDNTPPEDELASGEPLEVTVLDAGEPGSMPRPRPIARRSLARALGETAARLTIRSVRAGVSVVRAIARSTEDSLPRRVTRDAIAGARAALHSELQDTRRIIEPLIEDPIERVIAVITPVVLQSIDPDELVEWLDVNALLDRVDVDSLLDRVDVNAFLDKVDVNTLLDRVDANALARRARIGELVAEGTGDVAGSALDAGRRQAVALDILLARDVTRTTSRPGRPL